MIWFEHIEENAAVLLVMMFPNRSIYYFVYILQLPQDKNNQIIKSHTYYISTYVKEFRYPRFDPINDFANLELK